MNGSRTPDGHFGDLFCSSCARRFGQLFVLMVAGLLVTPMMLISMDLGQILLLLVVLGVLSTLVLIIPMDFGQKTGLWIIKKRFPSWSEGKIGELSSFWGMGALTVTVIGVWAVELMLMLFDALEIPYINMPQQRMWQPLFVFRVLQTGQLLQEFGYVALHSILMIITFFICSVAATIFMRWYHFIRNKKKTSSADVH